MVEWTQTPAHPLGSSRHVCDRVCIDGEEPMTCQYDFTVEVYSILGRVNLEVKGLWNPLVGIKALL